MLLVNDEEWRTVPFAHTERFARLGRLPLLRGRRGRRAGRRRGDRQAQGRRDARGRGARAARRTRARRRTRAAARCSRWPTVAQRVAAPAATPAVPTGSPPCRRSCTRARPSTSSRRRAGSSATCAPTTWAPSSRCSVPCPTQLDGVRIESALVRAWPGHGHARGHGGRARRPPRSASGGRWWPPSAAAPATRATSRRPSAVTVDGLGPRGGGAHAPDEWVGAATLRTRAEVALAVVAAILGVT